MAHFPPPLGYVPGTALVAVCGGGGIRSFAYLVEALLTGCTGGVKVKAPHGVENEATKK